MFPGIIIHDAVGLHFTSGMFADPTEEINRAVYVCVSTLVVDCFIGSA